MSRYLLVAAVLLVAVVAIWHPAPHPAALSVSSPPPELPRTARHGAPAVAALVYVVGAVRRPGLYRLRAASRVDDAVRAAGGLTGDADPAAVNLAARVADGDEVRVPRIGESPAPTRARRGTHRTPRASKKVTEVVNLNIADAPTLERVPGIGRMLAERIVALREREGPYGSLDELLDVSGMTPSRLDRASSYLRI